MTSDSKMRTQVAGLDENEMAFTQTPAKRYVESRFLVPLHLKHNVTLVTPSKAAQVIGLLSQTLQKPNVTIEQIQEVLHSHGLDSLSDVISRVASEPIQRPVETSVRTEHPKESEKKRRRGEAWSAGPIVVPRKMAEPADWFGSHGSPAKSERARFRGLSDRAVVVPAATRAAVDATPVQAAEVALARILNTDIGVLFLDRTCIEPAGFCPGEHVATLSLAPGEELTVEQKSFSKREVTYEEANEAEQQFDLELSSTLSNAIEEGMNRSEQHNTTSGWNVGGNIGAEFKGIKVGVQGGASGSVTDADQKSRDRSETDSFTASRKVAAKYRTQHKTTFKIVTENRFELTSKRVLRNPNRFTPIDLHYFKVLQQLRMSHERYGVRLCWAPFVEDPAGGVVGRIASERQAIQTRNAPALPPKPIPPIPPPARPIREVKSAVVTVSDFSATGGLSKNFMLDIVAPAGYAWDRDGGFVNSALVGEPIGSVVDREPSWYVVGEPVAEGDTTVKVLVHVGVQEGGLFGAKGTINLQVSARFVPTPDRSDETYTAAYAQWEVEVAQWQASNEKAIADANAKSVTEGDALEAAVWKTINPNSELLQRIVSTLWPVSTRDEATEVDLWKQLFEWEASGYDLYPSWWSDKPMRNPLGTATDFRNASWARVYLPLRTGREAEALAFIFTGGDPRKADASIDEIIVSAVDDLKKFRTEQFGNETGGPITATPRARSEPRSLTQKVIALGRWDELLPTDGTHCEVTVAPTNGADELSRSELDDANNLRDAQAKQLAQVTNSLNKIKSSEATFHLDLAGDHHNGNHGT